MLSLPDWLPAEVDSHVKTLFNNGGLGALGEVLRRLVSDPEMAAVWKALIPLAKNSQQLIDFLEFVRLHPVVMGWPTDILNVPGDAVQRKLFGKIASSCESVFDALKELGHKNNPQGGWALLEQAVRRNARQAAEKNDVCKLEAVVNFQGHLQEIQNTSDVVEVLEVIRLAALLANEAPDMSLPRRRDSGNATKVLLAQDLSRYVRRHFQKPLHAVVATTVNVALDIHDNALTPDAVRKLKLS